MDEPALFAIAGPKRWTLCFDPCPEARWLRWVVPGRFKHVRAFGYVPADGLWLFVDYTVRGLVVRGARDKSPAADALIQAWITGCELVQVEPSFRARFVPSWYCVGTIKRLIGLRSGALLPDTLRRHCLAQGGRAFDEVRHADPADSAGAGSRPGVPADQGAG